MMTYNFCNLHESSKSSTDDVAEFTIDSEHLDPNTNIVASSI